MYTSLFVCVITPFLLVYRLSRGQLDTALRHAFPGQRSEELANQFEEFFLHNADEITELIKRSQRSSNSTHLYSQQMVCSLVQVSNRLVQGRPLHLHLYARFYTALL